MIKASITNKKRIKITGFAREKEKRFPANSTATPPSPTNIAGTRFAPVLKTCYNTLFSVPEGGALLVETEKKSKNISFFRVRYI